MLSFKNKNFFSLLVIIFLQACNSFKPTDLIHLKNKNADAGKITVADSIGIILGGKNQTVKQYSWADIDTITGLRYSTAFIQINTGLYYNPYYSVFYAKSYYPTLGGIEIKWGKAKNKKVMRYFQYKHVINKLPINKWGYGFQRYFYKNYISPVGAYAGCNFNLAFIKRNNSPHINFEPFVGFDKAYKNKIRLHVLIGTQLAPLNENRKPGFQLQAGLLYQFKDVHKRYRNINNLHTI